MLDQPEDITVDAEKFGRILSRIPNAKPLSRADISERIKEKREAGRKHALELRKKNKRYESKRLGQWTPAHPGH
jgi:hypothetical protein